MEINRKPFQGVLNILSFNRHFYVFGILTLLVILLCFYIQNLPDYLSWTLIIGFSYGLIMPLIVSAYVYDFSGYYDFNWLKKINLKDSKENLVLNINAGFDETSFIIKKCFPNSELQVFDFYNAKQHTEPAIVRARKVSAIYPNTKQIISNIIPLEDISVDYIFLLSAAHEIRNYSEKVHFLNECQRVLKPNGKIIMVEHLRDLPNFAAFTIGFTHFFSKKTWKKAFSDAEFSSFDEKKFTPFMSIFTCNR